MNLRAIQDRITEYTRRLGLGELRAPDPLDADPAQLEDVGGFKLPANFQGVSQDAKDVEALIKQPGWDKLIRELEKHADRALRALRECESHDPIIVAGFCRTWKAAEAHLTTLERIINAKIQERDVMLADLAQKYGMGSVDDVLSEVRAVTQMKEQLKREGMVAITPEEIYDSD